MKPLPENILIMDSVAAYDRIISRHQMSMKGMVMPGTLEEKHKHVDPITGIPLMRRHFSSVFLLLSGELSQEIGLTETMVKPNDLVVIPQDIVSSSRVVRNCKGYCVHFETEFLRPMVAASITDEFPYFDLLSPHIVNLSDEQSAEIQSVFQQMIKEYHSMTADNCLLVKNYIYILLVKARAFFQVAARERKSALPRPILIAQDFKRLVEKNFMTTHSVQDFAKMLHISSKYLGDCVREAFGKSPGDIIQDMLMIEAKVLLRQTTFSIAEIAFQLGFEEQSYFSRVFKKHTDQTPQEFRSLLPKVPISPHLV
jgi:AraC family transcriptional regulator, transcriptional activator of pobA